MCGRFVMTLEPSKMEQFFGVPKVPKIIPRYNIAPSQQILAICKMEMGTGMFGIFAGG
jgi:putative SOS response-associated peptidase YedK